MVQKQVTIQLREDIKTKKQTKTIIVADKSGKQTVKDITDLTPKERNAFRLLMGIS